MQYCIMCIKMKVFMQKVKLQNDLIRKFCGAESGREGGEIQGERRGKEVFKLRKPL